MTASLALLTRRHRCRVVLVTAALALVTAAAAAGRLAPSAYARLGEDEVECEQRYGFAKTGKQWDSDDKLFPVVSGPGARTRTYLYQGWRVRVGFIDGVAACVTYTKNPGSSQGPLLRGDEVAAILAGESVPGQTWTDTTALTARDPLRAYVESVGGLVAGRRVWVRPDGSLARADFCQVTVESPVAVRRDPFFRREVERRQQATPPVF